MPILLKAGEPREALPCIEDGDLGNSRSPEAGKIITYVPCQMIALGNTRSETVSLLGGFCGSFQGHLGIEL